MRIFALFTILVTALLGINLLPTVFGTEDGSAQINEQSELGWPLPRSEEREKKLTFGLFVTPDPNQNPINPPERFTGYHSALDLEILPDEHDQEVPVSAACDGTILQAGPVEGYGGLIVQSCRVQDQDVTVLYGHLDYNQFRKQAGETVKRGEEIGMLGDEESPESGLTRKHLHFGVHKGTEIEVLGYVQTEAELGQFLDPLPLLQGTPR